MTEPGGLWRRVKVTGLYTLSPLHCGIGQTAAAVDLPVAREAGSDFPVIPASSIKGAARALMRQRLSNEQIEALFGPDLDNPGEGASSGAKGGAALLGFTEGRLLAYPMRAFGQPFYYVTCPLLLDRLRRDLRLLPVSEAWRAWLNKPVPENVLQEKAAVVSRSQVRAPLVIEDLVYGEKEVEAVPWLAETAALLGHELLPEKEAYTRQRLSTYLVSIPDEDFAMLIRRVVPVRARTQLTDGKTTDKWKGPDGKEQSGNLWYEEYVPTETLFVTLVGQRRPGDGGAGNAPWGLELFEKQADALSLIQIGGNETVGYGRCWWTGWATDGTAVPTGVDSADYGTPSIRSQEA